MQSVLVGTRDEKGVRQGFSLIDVLIAVVIAAVGIMSIMSLTSMLTWQQETSEIRADADYFATSWNAAFAKDPAVKQAVLSGNTHRLGMAVKDITMRTFASAGWKTDSSATWRVMGTHYEYSSFGRVIDVVLELMGSEVKITLTVSVSGGPGADDERTVYVWGLGFASGRTVDGDGPWESL